MVEDTRSRAQILADLKKPISVASPKPGVSKRFSADI